MSGRLQNPMLILSQRRHCFLGLGKADPKYWHFPSPRVSNHQSTQLPGDSDDQPRVGTAGDYNHLFLHSTNGKRGPAKGGNMPKNSELAMMQKNLRSLHHSQCLWGLLDVTRDQAGDEAQK